MLDHGREGGTTGSLSDRPSSEYVNRNDHAHRVMRRCPPKVVVMCDLPKAYIYRILVVCYMYVHSNHCFIVYFQRSIQSQ